MLELGWNDQEVHAPDGPETEALRVASAAGTSQHLPLSREPRIGRYVLLHQIGEGGSGIVYLAEQKDPVRRQVALKLFKSGLEERSLVARFEAECQALAMMDHPGIARVLDAGVSDTGRPYFVMDLVQGVPITEFCEKMRLSVRERLELFLGVCHAIQHAHQKGILHRDLKPGNVLVTTTDGRPQPLVIDFGVAKAVNKPLSEKRLFTAIGTLIGTPAYMSPEQADLHGRDVDTRSDIYSLGVLLYEILAGSTPFEARELYEAGLAEMQRIIREVVPPPLSVRRRQDRAAGWRKVRGSCQISHGLAIDRDLDWIVMKCLEKDRNRRYATVNGLASDLERYLRHEPILARPPSVTYKVGRFVRRHRTASAALLLIALTVIGSSAVTTKALLKATAERERSETRLRAALTFVDRIYTNAMGDLELVTGATRAHQVISRAGQEFVESLGADRESDANLRLVLARVSLRLVLAQASAPNFTGDYANARASADRAVALLESIPVDYRPLERFRLALELESAAATCLFRLGDLEEVRVRYRRMNTLMQQMLPFPQLENLRHARWVRNTPNFGHLTTLVGKPREAIEQHLLPFLESSWASALTDAASVDDLTAVADGLGALAYARFETSEFPLMIEPAREALRLRRVVARRVPEWGVVRSHEAEHLSLVASGLLLTGQTKEALAAYAEVNALTRSLVREDPANARFHETITACATLQARAFARWAQDPNATPAAILERLREADERLAEALNSAGRLQGASLEQHLCRLATGDIQAARSRLAFLRCLP